MNELPRLAAEQRDALFLELERIAMMYDVNLEISSVSRAIYEPAGVYRPTAFSSRRITKEGL